MEITCEICALVVEPGSEYLHLVPSMAEAADEEQDDYGELGDLEGNNLIQFAYQIATGMVRNSDRDRGSKFKTTNLLKATGQ